MDDLWMLLLIAGLSLLAWGLMRLCDAGRSR
jgi:hypothetical protein